MGKYINKGEEMQIRFKGTTYGINIIIRNEGTVRIKLTDKEMAKLSKLLERLTFA